jgi:hypothetical protein
VSGSGVIGRVFEQGKENMAQITIDTEMLIVALEDHGSEHEHFLNLETGEIEIVFDESVSGEIDEEFAQDMEGHPEKYRRIEPIFSGQAFDVMVDFVESLAESKAKQRLEEALNRRRPFRNFKDVLHYYPEIREDWFRFQEQAYKAFALAWLHREGIEAELRPLRHENA